MQGSGTEVSLHADGNSGKESMPYRWRAPRKQNWGDSNKSVKQEGGRMVKGKETFKNAGGLSSKVQGDKKRS